MATAAGGMVAGDGGEFLSPWSHHAGGLGVGAGAGEEVDLLGDAKELAFLVSRALEGSEKEGRGRNETRLTFPFRRDFLFRTN